MEGCHVAYFVRGIQILGSVSRDSRPPRDASIAVRAKPVQVASGTSTEVSAVTSGAAKRGESFDASVLLSPSAREGLRPCGPDNPDEDVLSYQDRHSSAYGAPGAPFRPPRGSGPYLAHDRPYSA